MRIARSGRFSREARARSAPPVHLVASQPHCPTYRIAKPRAFGVLVGHISQVTWAKACVDTLPMSQNNLRTAAKYVSINNISLKSKRN